MIKTTNHLPSINSIKKAAALKYDGRNTPKITAKGDGELAQKMVSLAKDNDVHIHYDPLLIDVLSRLELDEEIPETLFLAVAKIIAFAYYLQGKHPDSPSNSMIDDTLTLEHKHANADNHPDHDKDNNKGNNSDINRDNRTTSKHHLL